MDVDSSQSTQDGHYQRAGLPAIDLKRLRSSTFSDQAAYLREILPKDPTRVFAVTTQLISYVASGSLPPILLSLWCSVCKDPESIIAILRQPHNVVAQRYAIKHLGRSLRKESTFAKIWQAGSGAAGFAQIAASLSVRNARLLFGALGSASNAQGAREERRMALSELLRLLLKNVEPKPQDQQMDVTDLRPLGKAYATIAPGCDADTVLKWIGKMNGFRLRAWHKAVLAHAPILEAWLLKYDNKDDLKSFLNIAKVLIQNRPEFGLQALVKVSESHWMVSERWSRNIVENIFLPSVKQVSSRKGSSLKRHVQNELCRQCWRLVVQCLQKHDILRSASVIALQAQMIYRCAQAWNTFSGDQSLDESFKLLLKLLPTKLTDYFQLDLMLRNIAPSRRYETLRFFFQHDPSHGFDIGNADVADGTSAIGLPKGLQLPASLFFTLHAQDGFALFEKIYSSNVDFIIPYHKLIFPYPDSDRAKARIYNRTTACEDKPDYDAIRALLSIRARESFKLRSRAQAVLGDIRLKELPRRMKKATETRDKNDRGKAALDALVLCLCLGDSKIYLETWQWARRFRKDDYARDQIHHAEFVLSNENICRLAALPSNLRGSVLEEIKESIRVGNQIISLLVENATAAVSEPTFRHHSWDSVFRLIPEVIKARLHATDAFQDYHELSDDEVFRVLWKPTIDLLIDVESTLMQPAHQKLHYHPDDYLHTLNEEPFLSFRGPSLRFFDKLAEARDDFWERHRVSLDPSVATLKSPWPRGLSINRLFPYDWDISGYMPYIQSRAETVVFCNAEDVLVPLPNDKEVIKAIDAHVDSWPEALRLYLMRPPSKGEDRQDRISKAWDHATNELRRESMSKGEAAWFWMRHFQKAGVKADELDLDELKHSTESWLPTISDAAQRTSWDPLPHFQRLSKSCRISKGTMTCLDAMMSHGTWVPLECEPHWSGWGKWLWCWSRIEKISMYSRISEQSLSQLIQDAAHQEALCTSFWEEYDISPFLKIEAADAVTAASILLLDSAPGSRSSVLAKAFPSAEDPRIPALCLEGEGQRSRESLGSKLALIRLEEVKQSVPPELLAQLATSLLERMKSSDEADRPYSTFVSVIRLVLHGGRPWLAIPSILEFVLGMGEASSWHRHVLHQGVLYNLAPGAVKAFLNEFANSLVQRLETQAEAKGEQEAESETLRQPLVKVATLKLLPQLFQGAESVDLSSAIEYLGNMLKVSEHIDVRSAAVGGLLDMAKNAEDSTGRWKILDVLRTVAGPVASSLNERRPLTDWEQAERGESLPEIWGETQECPPVLQQLVGFGQKTCRWPREEAEAWDEMRYSVLQASGQNHGRWMKMFLQRCKVQDEGELPNVPIHPQVLKEVLEQRRGQMPAALFDVMKRHVLVNLNPPPWLSAMNETIKGDAELSRSNEGKHWLSVWDRSSCYLEVFRDAWRAEDLKVGKDGDRNGVSKDMVEEFMFEVFDGLLDQGMVSAIERAVGMMTESSGFQSQGWKDDRLRYVGRLKERIDGMRTEEWQRDAGRRPRYLPDSFGLKVRMTAVGCRFGGHDEVGAQRQQGVRDYVDGTRGLLEELAGSGRAYQGRLEMVKRQAQEMRTLQLEIAVGLGKVGGGGGMPSLAERLGVQVAGHLVRSSMRRELQREEVVRDVEGMIDGWRGSSVEEFREEARSVDESGCMGR